jgi:hypothetical protein
MPVSLPPVRSDPADVDGRLDGLVLPSWRILCVLNAKAASTSILWWLAAVVAEDPESMFTSRGPEVTRELTVHDRDLWRNFVRISDLSGRELARLLADPEWMRFTVVRHPVTRLWSAWQSKLLLREPNFVRDYAREPWFPRVPNSLKDVGEDFRTFVAALSSDRALLLANRHWSPQHLRLELGTFPYTHVGKVEQLERTRQMLEDHAHASGWIGRLHDVRRNTTLLPISVAELCSREVEEIEALYEADMSRAGFGSFCEHTDLRSQLCESEGYEAIALTAVRELIARHQRIGDLLEGGVGGM